MQRKTITDIQKLARKHGGKCLSKEYLGNRVHLKWVCKKGHTWSAMPELVQQGSWCPKCAGTAKPSIEDMREMAKQYGGDCLSKIYKRQSVQLRWKCKNGPTWSQTPKSIKHGSWCKECKNNEVLNNLQAIAKARGGKCLSLKYLSGKSHLLWQCKKGHEWGAAPSNIKAGKWCPFCAGRRDGIEDFKEIARNRGGKCLSDKYINSKTKLRWQCEIGHEWEATPCSVKMGTWCSRCAAKKAGDKLKHSLDQMKELAAKYGGLCISKEYLNESKPLKWQCKYGHIWSSKQARVKKGLWCPECKRITRQASKLNKVKKLGSKFEFECISTEYMGAGKRHQWKCEKGHRWEALVATISSGSECPECKNEEILKKIKLKANERGGECLSKKYINSKTVLTFSCEKVHRWKTSPSSIQRGRWCPKCSGRRWTLKDAKKLAKERGGKCLSEEKASKILWECSERHQWKASYSNVKYGTWCSICSSAIGERICRIYFETLFQDKFPKARPKWLKNDEENLLELDGFSRKKRLAFEHQGIQHYEESPYFHQTKSDFVKRKRDDNVKRKLCADRSVVLIEIPSIPLLTQLDRIRSVIWKECKKLGYKDLPDDFFKKKVDLKPAYLSREKQALKELKEIAKSKNGQCLSKAYISNHQKLKWRCEIGHVWEAPASAIKSGNWCMKCAKKALGDIFRDNIENMKILAENRGGKCISKKYTTTNTPLLWECERGHRWKAAPANIKNGQWCPVCRQRIPLGIELMKKIAKEKRGKCLSKEYINGQTKLRWKCHKGHLWEAKPSKIKNLGQWCPFCAGKRDGIEDFKKIARDRGGECLSDKYINSKSKLRWRCKKGHEWEAVPSSVKMGTWCPQCGGSARLTIADMQNLAKERNGRCLSKKYVNAHTKLEWECASGHKWFATPHSVKNSGTWCPICRRRKKQ